MTRISVVRLPFGRIACAMAAVVMLAASLVGCGGTQTTGGGESGRPVSVFEKPDESIGDVKVWLMQNTGTATGYREGTRSRPVDLVLVNESHSQYRGLSSDRLTAAEQIIPDIVARRLLSDLVNAGMTSPKSGAVGVTVPPDQYAKGVTKRIHMWIGVEHRLADGRTSYTFLPRYVMTLEELNASEEKNKIFNACQLAVLGASWNSMPKDRSQGTTAEDLRDAERRAPRRPEGR